MRFVWLFLLLTFCAIPNAQQATLYFEKLNTDNGLSHNKVNCILQDHRGFFWIGTEDGLNRYDGNDFVIYRSSPGQKSGISGNIITDLMEDESGVLWISTADGGISKYDYRLPPDQQFVQYKNIPGDSLSIPTNTVHAMVQDRQGYLWLASGGHAVLRFDKATGRFDQPVPEGTRTALALGLDHQDTLWVGRQGGGLLKVNTKTLAYTSDPRYTNLYVKLPHVVVTALHEDADQQMWFGSWDKILYRYSFATQEEKAFDGGPSSAGFISDEISAIDEDVTGRLWFGGKQHGLQMYDKSTGRFTSYQYDPSLAGSIADDRVNCLFLDKAGMIWAGTNKGISIASLHQQFVQTFLPGTFKSDAPPVTIYDFYKDQQQRLWIGTNHGIYLRRGDQGALEHIPISDHGEPLAVTCFYEDVDGTFYIGTNISLFQFDPVSFKTRLLPNTAKDKVMSRIIESRVVSILRDTIDQHPVLLVSPYGHYLAYYDLVDQRWVSRLDTSANIVRNWNLKDNLIRSFYRGRDGRIWFSMTGSGLGLLEKTPEPHLRYFAVDPTLNTAITNNNVFDLVEDEQGHFWISTYGGGLHYFDPDAFTFSHVPASGNLLEGIARDDQGRIWIVSGGVLHYYAASDSSYVSFELPDLEKGGGIRGHMYKDQGGIMYVAGPDYFIEFDPRKIHATVSTSEIYFTDFKIFNNSFSHLLFQEEIRLRYNQNYFTVEFAAPHSPGTEKMQYRYMLEGVDEDWIEAGTRHTASYPNTGNGHFVFKVQASPGDGKWDGQTASIRIYVIPPIWKRWWFILLAVMLILAVIYGIQRYRLNEVLKRQEIRNRIAQDLHDNVGSTLSSISVYSQVARIRNDELKDEPLNELLHKISATSNDMISDMNDIVWAINPRNDSMEKIIHRMESYARPLLATRNIQFDLQYDKSVLQTNLDMEKRKNLYLIFKEAVSNAFKYSGCQRVEVRLSLARHVLDMRIKDDGVGFVLQQDENKLTLSGNGLDNIRSRAKEMNGTASIETTPGEGTLVHVTVNIP
jgi:ligand-binding sensor domain-containing protein/two-component sensor histidine kinase